MARPTDLTPATQRRIVRALKAGATFKLAAQYGGISYNTFNEWRKRGKAELDRADGARVHTDIRESERPFVEFYEATKKAEADAAIKWLEEIDKAAKAGNWPAAAWKLERRYPEEYGRRIVDANVKGAGEDGAIIIRWANESDPDPNGDGSDS